MENSAVVHSKGRTLKRVKLLSMVTINDLFDESSIMSTRFCGNMASKRISHSRALQAYTRGPPKEWRCITGRPKQTRLRTVDDDLCLLHSIWWRQGGMLGTGWHGWDSYIYLTCSRQSVDTCSIAKPTVLKYWRDKGNRKVKNTEEQLLTWSCLQCVYVAPELCDFTPQFLLYISFYHCERQTHLT